MIRSRHRKMVQSDFQKFWILKIFIRNIPGLDFAFFGNFSHVPLSIDQNSTKINKNEPNQSQRPLLSGQETAKFDGVCSVHGRSMFCQLDQVRSRSS